MHKSGGQRQDLEMFGSKPRSGWNIGTRSTSPNKTNVPQRKEPSVMYYPPNGSGRDSYVI